MGAEGETNYQEEYAPMENAMRSGPVEEFPVFFSGAKSAFDLYRAEEMQPESHRVYFHSVALPKIVSYILSRSDLHDEPDLRKDINKFFLSVLNYFSVHLEDDSLDTYALLCRLLNPNMAFYILPKGAQHRDFPSLSEAMSEMCPNEHFEKFKTDMRSTSPPLSMLFYANVEYFYQIGGFANIAKRISQIPAKEMNLMKHMVLPLSQCREYLQEDAMAPIVEEMRESIFGKLLEGSTGPLIPNEKGLARDIVVPLEKLLCRLAPEEEVRMVLDKFKLELALKGFDSSNLERRLRSLGIITKAVERALPSKDDKDRRIMQFIRRAGINNPRSPAEDKPQPRPLDPQFVLGWLKETDFANRLLGNKNVHPEELKQGIWIFRFLAIHGILADDAIDQLWSFQVGKHESVKATIFDSLLLLAEEFALPQLLHLRDLIGETKSTEWDFESLRFLSQLTALAVEKDANRQEWFGLDTLYGLAINPSDQIPDTVIESAFEHLLKLIKLDTIAPRRQFLLDEVASTLSTAVSMPTSLRLIQEILEAGPAKKKKNLISRKGGSLKSSIEALNQQHQVVDAIMKNLPIYKDTARLIPSQSLQKGKKIRRYTHIEHVRTRLDFLLYFLENSSLELDIAGVEALWNHLVLDALSVEEKHLCFRWLQLGVEKLIQPSASQHLFEHITAMEPEQLDEPAYELTECYFRALNTRSGKLAAFQSRVGGKPVTKHVVAHDQTSDKALVGYETLWNVALQCEDHAIGLRAIECLCHIHQSLPSETSKPRYRAVREEFISRCLNHLEEAISVQPPHLTILDRCIILLKKFLSEYEEKSNQQQGTGTINLSVRVENGNDLSLSLRSSDTIKTLRQQISTRCGRPVNSFRVIHANQELVGDKTLKEARINNKSQIIVRIKEVDYNKPPSDEERFKEYAAEVTIRSWLTQILEMQLQGLGLRGSTVDKLIHNTQANDKNMGESRNLAVSILSQHDNFQRLFKLLNLQGVIAGRAWDLLDVLPPNPSLLEEFARVDQLEQHLATHLDVKVILKLAYSLNTISILVKRLQSQQAQNEWCDRFVALGGINRLLDTLLDTESDQSSAHITCYSKLLELVNFCVDYEKKSSQADRPSSLAAYPRLSEAFARILLILEITAKESLPEEETQSTHTLVGHSTRFLANSIAADNSLISQFFEWNSLSSWLRCVLLASSSRLEREQAEEGLLAMCRLAPTAEGRKKLVDQLLPQLLSFLPDVKSYPRTAEYYFILVGSLLRDNPLPAPQSGELLTELCGLITSHPVNEVNDSKKGKDTSLIGLLDLVRIHVSNDVALKKQAREESLLTELFHNCLFNIPSMENHGPDAPPKCKSNDSRYAAYRLLVELCRDETTNFDVLAGAMLKHILKVRPRNNWQITPDAKKKAAHGYIGLENMGATCYMNSLMQQLYLMPSFRADILSVEDQSEKLEDSPLYQLQYMLAYLQESLKGSYRPTPFTESYKDWEGNPMNTRVQMDANEFFNTLFDKLECLLAPTTRPNLLKELCGGVLANQIISQQCDHISENNEEFYTVGVEIKNKRDIHSSFEAFIEGEMLQGDSQYYCEQCDKKVDALKRCCLKTLPSTLLIQLKRFEFDLMTMRNKKLNDECAFPMLLNVEPYTVEGIARREAEGDLRKSEALRESSSLHPPEYYQYQLTGVVVHTGTADGGHYYSFIKERTPLKGETCQWYEFNDSSVTLWNVEDLARECYGGKYTSKVTDRNTGEVSEVERDILNNAYILVYERVEAVEEEPKPRGQDGEQPEQALSSVVQVPPSIMEKIWKENRDHIIEKHVFDPNYFNFVWRLICLYTRPEDLNEEQPSAHVMQAVELATRFVTEIFAHARANQLLPMWSKQLCDIFSANANTSMWLLRLLCIKPAMMRSMLLYCPVERVRSSYANVIEQALLKRASLESAHYTSQQEKLLALPDGLKGLSHLPANEVESWNALFVESILHLLKDARISRYSTSQLFLVLLMFAEIGPVERNYLRSRHIFKTLSDYIMGTGPFVEEDPAKSKTTKTPTSPRQYGPPVNVNGAIALLAGLLVYMTLPETEKDWLESPPPTAEGDILHVATADEVEAVMEKTLWAKILKECFDDDTVNLFVTHITWNNPTGMDFVLATVQGQLEACSMVSQAKMYLRTLSAIYQVDDRLITDRFIKPITLLVEIIPGCLEKKEKDLARLYANWITSRQKSNSKVKKWCSKNSKTVNSVLSRVPPPSPPPKRNISRPSGRK